MKKTDEEPRITISNELLVQYMRKDINWLEGFATAQDNNKLLHKLNAMRQTLNKFCKDNGIEL